MTDNPYKILGLDLSAPPEVIKAAYKALMKRKDIHPDLGGDLSAAQKVNEAYSLLSDPLKKKELDSRLKSEGSSSGHSFRQKVLVICLHCYSVNELEDERLVFLAKCGGCKQPFDKRKAYRQQQTENSFQKAQSNQFQNASPRGSAGQQKSRAYKPPFQQESPPKPKDPAEVAYFLYMKGMYLRALSDYKMLIDRDGTNDEFHFMAGMCLYRLKDFQDASRYFLQAVRLNDQSFKWKVWLAKSLIKENRISQAIEILELVIREKPDNMNTLAILGTSYFKIGNYREAIFVLNKVVEKRPALYKSIYWLANAYYRMRQFSHARKYFIASRQIFPNNHKISEMIQHCERHLRMNL